LFIYLNATIDNKLGSNPGYRFRRTICGRWRLFLILAANAAKNCKLEEKKPEEDDKERDED
jgi:hypothetical protein